VLGLENACESLSQGTLPDNAVVITIDDGFHGVLRHAWPVLQTHSLPATVYVTSYYAQKQNPIFRLIVQYMFWKTTESQLNALDLGLPPSGMLLLRPEAKKDETMWAIINFGENELDERQRCLLLSELGNRLGVEYTALRETRSLSLLNEEEIRGLATAGLDIQLHTHRHRLPKDEGQVRREIEENREFLEGLTGRKLNHLCYPSGVWSKEHWPWLESLGIITATTCEPGLNYSHTPRLALRRFLDGENISQIEFEAEVSGFSELLRQARVRFLKPTATREATKTY